MTSIGTAPACILATATHCHLGADATTQLAALAQAPTTPDIVQRPLGSSVEPVPCKLLADCPLDHIDTRLQRVVNAVTTRALAAAGLSHEERQRTALFVGSSSFDISVSEHTYQQARSVRGDAIPLDGSSSSFGNLADMLSRQCHLHGPVFSFNTACTSSANALWYASRWLAAGESRHALVIGVEIFNDMTALGFQSLGLLTRSVMKPFDAARDGLVLGEAVSAVVLGPGSTSHYRVLGGANLCDTHSMSAANPDGSTIAHVIRAALSAAQLHHTDIGTIKVHGTASLLNDEAEASGLLQVFGDRLPPACALKPFLGHTLGACGAAETALLWQALTASTPFIPATPGIGADANVLGLRLTQQAQPPSPGAVLLNFFGFGGNNTALILGKTP